MLRMPGDCFPQWRGADGVVHTAHYVTYDHCYAGWWLSACNLHFDQVSRGGTHEAPTCLLCLGSRVFRNVVAMEAR